MDTLPIILIPHPHVRVDRDVLGGSPYVAGSRVPVRRLWAFYRSGASAEVLVKRYPRLGPGKIFDALAFAFDNQEVIERDLQREQLLLMRAEQPDTQGQLDLPFDGTANSKQAARKKDGAQKPRPNK
jgi:uncharacterized protein (DUF433 family)